MRNYLSIGLDLDIIIIIENKYKYGYKSSNGNFRLDLLVFNQEFVDGSFCIQLHLYLEFIWIDVSAKFVNLLSQQFLLLRLLPYSEPENYHQNNKKRSKQPNFPTWIIILIWKHSHSQIILGVISRIVQHHTIITLYLVLLKSILNRFIILDFECPRNSWCQIIIAQEIEEWRDYHLGKLIINLKCIAWGDRFHPKREMLSLKCIMKIEVTIVLDPIKLNIFLFASLGDGDEIAKYVEFLFLEGTFFDNVALPGFRFWLYCVFTVFLLMVCAMPLQHIAHILIVSWVYNFEIN